MTNAESTQPPILYGRFSARLRAFYTDVIIILVAMAAALIVATASGSENVSRIIGFSFVVVLVLFEPVLVSIFGSTIGHYLNNLRVVDNRTGGKVNFFKAAARTAIKTVLGVYSFISMLTTSRHQALHDWLTASTVQIRNAENARASDYVHQRHELAHPEMPTWYRRMAVTLGYLLLILIVVGLTQAALVSEACLDITSRCSLEEKLTLAGSNISAIGAGLLLIAMGWRGKLFGARLRRMDATPE